MIVGLDLLFLVPGQTGGRETHAREVVRAMSALPDAPEFVAFVNRETAEAGNGWWSEAGRVVALPRVSVRSRPSWALGEVAVLPRAAARAGVDVLHGIANFAPFTGPFARVLTLHDVLFRRFPELMPLALRAGTEALVPPAARRAHRVVTVSEASRADIVDARGIPADRIDAVPNGTTPPRLAGDAERGRRLAGRGDFVLSVASDLPHKNLDLLAGLDVVFAGPGTERLGGLGAVPEQELEDLWAAASAYVTPTLYEGFGLPVLEAMARGVPVACSDLPVLREVAGDDAAYFDPRDREAARAAIAAARASDGATLAARAARFTWESAARGTLRAYERALAERRGPSRPARASR